MIEECPFCNNPNIIEEYGSVFTIKDNYPVTKGHHLMIPFRHVDNYFSMTKAELDDANKLIVIVKDKLESNDSTITGFNIGANSGKSAGQKIMHAHIHLIPRRNGDINKPRGGVRGVIPDKMSY